MKVSNQVIVFKRVRRLVEVRSLCKKRKWKLDSKKHDEDGWDHVRIDFKVDTLGGPVTGHVLFNTFNGRFFGELSDGEKISSNQATHDHCLWFNTLLETLYSND